MAKLGKVRKKLVAFVAITVTLCIVAFALDGVAYRGSASRHTLMELAATLLAAFVGAVALVRFYTKKDNTYLFIGMGFFGAAALDGYHAVVTSHFFAVHFPSSLSSLIPWSWNASRTYLAVLMALSCWAWRRERTMGKAGRIPEGVVYEWVALLTVLTFLFFSLAPLPRAHYPELLFPRPQELIAGAFFLLALVGYLQKKEWRRDQFESWLVVSLILGAVCQIAVMSKSALLFDAMFDLAHFLKILSYLSVLAGLFCNMHQLFDEALRSKTRLQRANDALESEVAKRKAAQDQVVSANAALQERAGQLKDQKELVELANRMLVRSNEELKQFAYVASHDLQEPLRKVTSFCQMLEEDYGDRLDEEGRRYIEYAVDGAKRMKQLICDLLEYSRIESHGQPMKPVPASQAFEEAMTRLDTVIEAVDAEITCDQLPTVHGDSGQLCSLFQNLIGNAVKYCDQQPPKVHVGIAKTDDHWVFSVSDNGIGIDEAFHDRIFAVFQRLHSRTSYAGTGIGLAICRRIVDRLGGEIWVESKVGDGSTFFFSVPRCPAPEIAGKPNDDASRLVSSGIE